MSLRELRRKVLARHSVRARIALACVGLFLVTGVAFVAATYALVAHSVGGPEGLPTGTPASVVQACITAKASHNAARHAQCSLLGAADLRTRLLHALLVWSFVDLGIAIIVAGILWWAIGRRVLRPLHAVTAAARRASQEHLDERISLDGPDDELKELADTFDNMLNRLDGAFHSQGCLRRSRTHA